MDHGVVGKKIDSSMKSKFDKFFLDQINVEKIGSGDLDHNELRLYNTFNGSFK